ncbi:MAG: threonine--tRNA ligase [Candidatus Calescibacterium sp.]|nr:threonine--tRNA ligase [Candidatus Calescibacterium sp.]MCX7734818.1 threonine--tRNA ligase [bacterium]MDW8087730.1 threonine--tRNA ligase [Candidatus Calescibacterium sp.]
MKTGLEILKERNINDPSIAGIKQRGKVYDLHTQIDENEQFEFIKYSSPDGLDIMRHTSAHVLAQAVKRLFPETLLSVGPTTEVGFFYDFYRPEGFTEEDLKKIDQEMQKIKKENLIIQKFVMKREDAIRFYEERGEKFKVEILKDIKDEYVSFYKQGEFVDLCRGPHLISTGNVGAVKLIGLSAVHFKGNENFPMLTRIYGVAFATEQDLENYFKMQEELKKRDHRKLGRELDLFLIDEENIGAGLVVWLQKGAKVRRLIEDLWLKIHEQNGYQLVYTPHVANEKLWKISGHLELYSKFMFPSMSFDTKEQEEEKDDFERKVGYQEKISYRLKPMNCPFHITIFKSKTRSYRDLPMRLCEFGTVYRYEKSGVLHGLLRVRGFTQDDAHIFLKLDQLEDEVISVIDIMKRFLSVFGFKDFFVFLSTRPEKRVGTDDEWDFAENALRKALDKSGFQYSIDPGEGVFYGPKIDVKIKDVLGRVWQCSTIQLDFNLPRKFSAFYVDSDNTRKQVYIIHRAILGSFERFFGILIEHTAGNLPHYFAPTQCVVISVKDTVNDYAEFIYDLLSKSGLRVELDLNTGQRLSKRIRDCEIRKIPFMIVLGEKEKNEKVITIREKGKDDIKKLSIQEGINYLLELCTRVSGE